MNARRLWTLLILCLFALTVSACSSRLPGHIIFQTDRDGNNEIYIMRTDGSGQRRLTNNTAEDISPVYIPALKKIGFVSDRTGIWLLYTMNLDGSDQAPVTESQADIFNPDWSPDGGWILVASKSPTDEACPFTISLINSDGSGFRELMEDCNADYPDWSPDGESFLFLSDRTGDYEIYIADWDGSNITQLTDSAGFDGRARWSPDGSKIVFESNRDGDWELFIMEKDGSHQTQLTQNTLPDWFADWSPDGKWIVYVSMRDEDTGYEICVIDVNGQNQTQLTENDTNDIQPRWIP